MDRLPAGGVKMGNKKAFCFEENLINGLYNCKKSPAGVDWGKDSFMTARRRKPEIFQISVTVLGRGLASFSIFRYSVSLIPRILRRMTAHLPAS